MKKSIIIIAGILLCLCVIAVVSANAQSIDKDRMDRDLKVATNVLKGMLEGDRGMLFGGREVDASYLEDYGVIFTMPRNYMFYAPRVRVETPAPRDQREVEAAGRADARSDRSEAVVIGRGNTYTNFSEDGEEEYIEKVKSFLLNYTTLIGQLKPSDRVMVKQKSNSNYVYAFALAGDNVESKKMGGSTSLEVKIADVRDYKSGKLSESAAKEKVKIIKEEDVDVEDDVRLFGNILKTVYESGVSSTYFISEKPGVERMKDFGAIYSIRFYSSNPMGFGDSRVHHMPTLRLREVPQSERDAKVKDMYPDFIKGLKENLVEYGRTISSLNENENVILKIRLTTCEGCGIPESAELIVKASVLKDYSAGKLNLSSAVAKVQVKESGKQ